MDFLFCVHACNFLTPKFKRDYVLLATHLSLMLCMEKSWCVEAVLLFMCRSYTNTLSPQWNQTFEFLETGEPLILHVKDHNAVLPTASIGHCTVEYSMLSPNQSAEKWIPLQGVKSGEIHVRVALKVSVPGSEKKNMLGAGPFGKGHKMSTQVRNT